MEMRYSQEVTPDPPEGVGQAAQSSHYSGESGGGGSNVTVTTDLSTSRLVASQTALLAGHTSRPPQAAREPFRPQLKTLSVPPPCGPHARHKRSFDDEGSWGAKPSVKGNRWATHRTAGRQQNTVVTHGPPFRLWQEGGRASPGVKRFAEDGQADEVVKELTEIRKSLKMIHAIHQAPNVSSGTGRTAARVLVVPRASRLSLLTKLIPSPDWFTGVDSLDLCDGGHWKPRVTLDLHPYDAGTDSGFTFSSPNFPTSPRENITRITSQSPNHPASSFYYPRLAELPPLATLTIVRRTKRLAGRLHPSHHIRRVPGTQHFSETPLDCEVSRWSSWGLCSAPQCAQTGLRQRTRFVLLSPANDGEPCPDLEEQSPCVREGCSVDGDRR
ncbi:spondin-2a isoform X1 [Polypterus senegalus]|uniref:spondin-2a isoform X1 n=1 Tax=Polypterus senegalus TaxID=55291 RepID=UPI001964A424|nr:spondin-2a isoform X1 [Polypterus senegalus]